MKLSEKQIFPHGQGLEKFNVDKEEEYIQQVNGWELVIDSEPHKIKKEFQFSSFNESMNFANKIAQLANEFNHHPNILIYFKRLILEYTTNNLKGLTENDFIMAAKIDEM